MFAAFLTCVHATQEMSAASTGGDDELSMASVVTLCVVMYGSIAGLWVLFRGLPKDHPNTTIMRVALLCVSWSSMSVGMHVLNKGLASTLKAPALISLVQMAVAAIAMMITSCGKLFLVPPSQLRTWLFVPIFFAGMLCSSFYTFEYISLSLLTIVRNLTPLVVLPTERAVMPEDKKPQLSGMVIMSLFVMIGGAAVYCNGIEISVIGLTFAGVNMILAVSDRVIQRRLLTEECKDMSSDVCALMSNTLGMIPTMALAMGTHEVATATGSAQWSDPQVLVLLLLSGFIGLGINYFGFETQRAISATSFFVLQNVTKLVVVGMGVFMFGDPLTSITAMGIMLSVSGSAMYGFAQMRLNDEARERVALLKKDGVEGGIQNSSKA